MGKIPGLEVGCSQCLVLKDKILCADSDSESDSSDPLCPGLKVHLHELGSPLQIDGQRQLLSGTHAYARVDKTTNVNFCGGVPIEISV